MKKVLSIFFIIVFCGFHSIECSVPTKIIDNIELILKNNKTLPIVAVAGCPGVGKTTFAKMLSDELFTKHIYSIIISFDDFNKSPEEIKGLVNELDLKRIRWNDLHRTLEDIKQGNKQILIQKIDQLTKERKEEILDLNGIDLIIFEGMYTLSNNSLINLLSYSDLGIYMETTAENICKWKWEREKKKRVSRTLNQFENHMSLIFEDFIRFVYPSKENANWVIFANDQHELSVVGLDKISKNNFKKND